MTSSPKHYRLLCRCRTTLRFSHAAHPKPHPAADGDLLDSYSRHYTITATCPCGHHRELFARPIQAMLGKGVLIGKVRDCRRCHKCQKRRSVITVTRMPR